MVSACISKMGLFFSPQMSVICFDQENGGSGVDESVLVMPPLIASKQAIKKG
jgi:hypothetical protein